MRVGCAGVAVTVAGGRGVLAPLAVGIGWGVTWAAASAVAVPEGLGRGDGVKVGTRVGVAGRAGLTDRSVAVGELLSGCVTGYVQAVRIRNRVSVGISFECRIVVS